MKAKGNTCDVFNCAASGNHQTKPNIIYHKVFSAYAKLQLQNLEQEMWFVSSCRGMTTRSMVSVINELSRWSSGKHAFAKQDNYFEVIKKRKAEICCEQMLLCDKWGFLN